MEEKNNNPSEEQIESDAPAVSEPAVEPAVEETAPEPEAAPEPVAEEPESETAPVAETAPVPEAKPTSAQPARRARSRRHVPRRERRPRTGKVQAKKPAKRGSRKPIVRLPRPESEQGGRQERRGVVVSAAMDKTVVVKVDTTKAHTKYRKVVRRSKKFHAHDEAGSAKVGDVVRIVETRPLSATKRWRVVEVVEAAK
jgi:small subunit ribosomal protein S17